MDMINECYAIGVMGAARGIPGKAWIKSGWKDIAAEW
jgi:hypothetical protein